MRELWSDVRHGARVLRRQPAFTLVALVTLALGIGAATTIFSVIQNVLFDPFPGHTVERVVAFHIRDLSRPAPGGRSYFQVPEFLDYQEQVRCFEEVIAGTGEDVLYSTREGTEQFYGGLVTPNNFSFLGVAAAHGRALRPEDAEPGATPVFVLTHNAWVSHFGADPSAIGRTFVLNGVPTTLVGVMPPNFAKLGADLYRPVALARGDRSLQERYFLLQARLKEGVTLEQARAEVELVARRLARIYPKLYPERFAVEVVPLLDSVIGPFRKTLYTLGAAVGLLLLIACSNVSNMLLARGAGRQREMAVRAALGARRARLVRQLLVEALVLALAAAALGCALAWFGIQAVVAAIPEYTIPRQTVIQMNVPVLLFSLATATASALLCGLVPALQSARRDVAERLKDGGKGTGAGAGGHRWTSTLVVGEVALSLVLLAAAGLLMRSFVHLQAADLGLDPRGVWHARVSLPADQYEADEEKHRFFAQLTSRLRAVPGIVGASTTSAFPLFGGYRSEVEVHGRTHADRWEAFVHLVDEGYDETLGLRLRRGRFVSDVDVAQARKVAVVNESFVRRYLPGEEPMGATVRLAGLATLPRSPVREPVFEIVGVVADAKNDGPQQPVMPEAFVPSTLTGALNRLVVVRTSGVAALAGEAVKREAWALDRNVALTLSRTLEESLQRLSYAGPRLVLMILSAFAAAGLVLVAIGVFSVIAYTVSRRTRDIGVRVALGAQRADVLRLVVGGGLKMIAGGIAVGVAATVAASRVLASQLYGVTPHDPATLAGVVGVVVLAGLAACYVPARRASRVDPLVALRTD